MQDVRTHVSTHHLLLSLPYYVLGNIFIYWYEYFGLWFMTLKYIPQTICAHVAITFFLPYT